MKRCTKCKRVLPEREFYDRSDSDSLQSHCKECVKSYSKEYYNYRKKGFHGLKLCECGCGQYIKPIGADGKPRHFVYGHAKKRDGAAEVLRFIKNANRRSRFEIEMVCHLGQKEAGTILKYLSDEGDIFKDGRDWVASNRVHAPRAAKPWRIDGVKFPLDKPFKSSEIGLDRHQAARLHGEGYLVRVGRVRGKTSIWQVTAKFRREINKEHMKCQR